MKSTGRAGANYSEIREVGPPSTQKLPRPAATGRARTHVTDPLVAVFRASRALHLETLVATPLASFSA